jgi:hypothetical protein
MSTGPPARTVVVLLGSAARRSLAAELFLPASAVEGELRRAMVHRPVADLTRPVGDRVVDGVGADVAPMAIEAVGGGGGPAALDLEQAARDSEQRPRTSRIDANPYERRRTVI